MRPSPTDCNTSSIAESTHRELPLLREELRELRALAKRLEADTILLAGDRDAALREISHLRLFLVRSLPAIGFQAEYGDDPAARDLSVEIRAALRA